MVPAWSLLLALLAGAVAGWFARAYYLNGRPAAAPAARPIAGGEPAPEVTEPALKMEAVLTELERRYQGRTAEPEPPARPKSPRRPRAPKKPGSGR